MNPDVLRLNHPVAGRVVVKDFSHRRAWVRRILVPWLIRHEELMLQLAEGVPGVPRSLGRVGHLAFAIEYLDGLPLRRRTHRHSLPIEFFDELCAILTALRERGVAYLDLKSPTNVLCMRETGSPALVDFGSAYRPWIPWRWIERIEADGIEKLRRRFQIKGRAELSNFKTLDHYHLSIGSTRFSIRDEGRLADPVPILCLHDAGLSSAQFRPLLRAAESQGRRVIAIDLPGFGSSRAPRGSIRLGWVARHLSALIRTLRVPAVDLLGWGYGALVARKTAALSDRVRSLRSVDAPLNELRGGFASRYAEALEQPEQLRQRILRSLPRGLDGESIEILLEDIQKSNATTLRRAYAGLPLRHVGERKILVDLPLPEKEIAISSPLLHPDEFWQSVGG